MNNVSKSYDLSDFPETRNGLENHRYDQSMQAVLRSGLDPLQMYATYEGLTEEDMAYSLRCDVTTYRQHIATVSARKGPILSPLKPFHILNFCKDVGIHPAFFASREIDPLKACAPHIFEAIKAVAYGIYSYSDREQALQAIAHEKERYEDLISRVGNTGQFFQDINAFTLGRRNEHVLKDAMKTEIIGIEENRLRDSMLHTFNQYGLLGLTRPETHASDFQYFLHENVGSLKTEHDKAERITLQTKQNLDLLIGVVFGEENLTKVLNQSHGVVDLDPIDPEEAEPSRYDKIAELQEHLEIKFKLKPNIVLNLAKKSILCNRAEDAVRMIAEGYLSYLEVQGDARREGDKFERAKKYLKMFDEWQQFTEMPHHSFVQYLYINHVNSMQKSVQLEYQRPSGPEVA